jgi:hypothetical protein
MDKEQDRTQRIDRVEYIRQVLAAYRRTPGTTGQIRRPDRMLAGQLHQRGVSPKTVENALLLAAGRRLLRSPDSAPLGKIRSLAYFLPIIEEVRQLAVSQQYFEHIRHRLERLSPIPSNPLRSPR